MGSESEDSSEASVENSSPEVQPKGRHAKRRYHPARTREATEAAFLHKATDLGFGVAVPWGNSERYDLVLDTGRRLWRVQLKCSNTLFCGGHSIQPMFRLYGKGKQMYTPDDIDVLVAHIPPADAWYVIPIEAVYPCTSLRFIRTAACTGIKALVSNTSAKRGTC